MISRDVYYNEDFYSKEFNFSSIYYYSDKLNSSQLGINKVYDISDNITYSFVFNIDNNQEIVIAEVPLFYKELEKHKNKKICEYGSGMYDDFSNQCYYYKKLDQICIKINKQNDYWQLNTTYESYGCFQDQLSPYVYQKIKISNGLIEYPQDLQLQVTVRNGKDPSILAGILTDYTFNFGYASKDLLVVGIVLFIVGFFMSIQPSVYLWKVKSKEQQYRLFKNIQ